jgi:hypothetical protein
MQFARVYYSKGGSFTDVRGADLYFSDGRPLLVFSWRRNGGRLVPEECLELDPDKLRSASSNGTIYRYEGEVRGDRRS